MWCLNIWETDKWYKKENGELVSKGCSVIFHSSLNICAPESMFRASENNQTIFLYFNEIITV